MEKAACNYTFYVEIMQTCISFWDKLTTTTIKNNKENWKLREGKCLVALEKLRKAKKWKLY